MARVYFFIAREGNSTRRRLALLAYISVRSEYYLSGILASVISGDFVMSRGFYGFTRASGRDAICIGISFERALSLSVCVLGR